jgi:hypothetical protein
MHLWDKTSGNLTDFTTHFSFVINSQNNVYYADGLAFFLAPNGSTTTTDSDAGTLGLCRHDQALDKTANDFVAVEFDIAQNIEWDPPGVHVGIDIKSMQSVATVPWSGANISIMEGRFNEAWINYNSTSHNLSVLFTGLVNNAIVWQSLSCNIDLRHHLPEWVTFGFSAATGGSATIHTISTWDFNSTFEDIVTNPTVASSPSPNPVPRVFSVLCMLFSVLCIVTYLG